MATLALEVCKESSYFVPPAGRLDLTVVLHALYVCVYVLYVCICPSVSDAV